MLGWVMSRWFSAVEGTTSGFTVHGAAIGLVSFAFTLGCKPGFLVLVHYCGLMAFIWCLSRLLFSGFELPHKVAKWVSIVATIAVVYVYGARFDMYDERWKSEDGTSYVDTYQRFGVTLTHRMIHFDNVWSHGPMKGDVKPRPHGMWTTWGGGTTENQFYWYGEEVTEGEWHLRNK